MIIFLDQPKEYLMKKVLFFTLLMIITGLIISCSKTEKPKTQAHVAHILIMYQGSMRAPAEVTRTQEEALALAQDVRKMALAGDDFAELAKKYSDGPTKVRGGELSPFGRGVMAPAFEEAAFTLKKGQISEVVETDFGYHIIKGL